MHLFAALADDNRPASALLAEFDPYVWSGELNFSIGDVATALKVVEAEYTGEPDTSIDHLDGLTVSAPQWWFNIRPSNTEPFVRINVEGDDPATMAATRDQLLSLLRRSM